MPNATSVVLLVLVSLASLAPGRAHASEQERDRAAVASLGDAYRAFEAGHFRTAYQIAVKIDQKRLENADYAQYVVAQSAALAGEERAALRYFRRLAKQRGSRFRELAGWRVADMLWKLGRYRQAQGAYRKLVAGNRDKKRPAGDLGLAAFRIADAYRRSKKRGPAIGGLRAFLREYPAHPLARDAEARLLELGGPEAARLDPDDRIARAQRLIKKHQWHESIAELATIGDDHSAQILRERDYWTAMTLFKMRRRYKDAGDILLRIYKDMGGRAASALFHGARALSRADFDAEAITWYQRVVAEYPRSPWAGQAQFLSGWLEFNMGNYSAAVTHLETTLRRYKKSRWAREARWFLGLSHYLLGHYEQARDHFAVLARKRSKLIGGKGRYWLGRTLQKLGRTGEAYQEYRDLVSRYPFSWYAHLARARLAEKDIAIDPFGDRATDPGKVPAIAEAPAQSLAADPLIQAADELIAAGLEVEAGVELHRGERAFLKRHKRRSVAMATLLDRYRRAQNFHRPWMLAVVYGGSRALNTAPRDRARVWWQHAYPRAYRELIERWRHLGDSPEYYLYAIMRKESGFNPHTLSYADALGLLQMIPPTTRRVVKQLGIEYSRDLLYDPVFNIKTGSWYIGHLLQKFNGQIPFGAGAFNSGPRPVMRWMDQFGHLPVDEFVELVPYRQTREYMKKVTETYSRYLYLYEGKMYNQPLVVDRNYDKNDLTY